MEHANTCKNNWQQYNPNPRVIVVNQEFGKTHYWEATCSYRYNQSKICILMAWFMFGCVGLFGDLHSPL